MALTKEKIQEVHDAIREALTAVAIEHGLTLSNNTHIRYNANTFKLTAEFGDEVQTNGVDPKFFANAQKHAWKTGLNTQLLGEFVDFPGLGKAKWIGMSGPVKAVVEKDGKNYTIRADQLKRIFDAKK